MLKRTLALTTFVIGLLCVSPAPALMIDSFEVGGTTLNLDDLEINKWDLETGLASSHVYNGKRYTQLDWQPETFGNPGDSATIAVNSGSSGVAALTKTGDPRVWFGYGERAFDFTWDEDWTGSDKDQLKITLVGGLAEQLRIKFYLHGKIGGIDKYLNDEIVFSPGQTEGYYALTGTANPQNVDVDLLRQHVTGMAVYYVSAFNGDSDWSMEQVELVPEPATMSLVGLGGLGVLARRRRR